MRFQRKLSAFPRSSRLTACLKARPAVQTAVAESVASDGLRAAIRSSLAVAIAAGMASTSPAFADSEQLVKALAFKPRQADVVYEKVEPNDVDSCSIEEVSRDDGKGFWVTGPAGQPLRWFADTNSDNKIDRWSYYNAGVEVYRESDTDGNRTADEYRWLSTEGMRRGADRDEDGKIDAWSMISAEEVTAEVVRAAATGDATQFARLLINEEEIAALGLGKEKSELLLQRVTDARKQFADWAAGQSVVTSRSRWTNFGADKPGIVPAGTDGSTQDVVVYENVVALLEDSGKAKQLLVGTMIQVGPSWRLVDLPNAVTDGDVVSNNGVFFRASFSPRGEAGSAPVAGGISKAMERLVNELQEVDGKLAGGEGDTAVLQARRADTLEKLVREAQSPADQTTWIRQFADTVSAAAQTGEYPGGVLRLRDFVDKLGSVDTTEDEVAYVVYRMIYADHNQEMMDPKADYEALQADYMKNLQAFVAKYPKSPDSADAMIQIALSSEFSGETKTAAEWYQKAGRGFADTDAGRKATGALRRLQLEGKRFGLEGKTLDGQTFNSQAYLGGPVVYHCWASWCEGCKAEMRALKELQAKYAHTKFKVIGINFDNSDKDMQARDAFLRENNFPWPHLFDAGGLDSDLAVGYGILTLPMNVVVDAQGKVIKTGVHWSELDALLEDLVK